MLYIYSNKPKQTIMKQEVIMFTCVCDSCRKQWGDEVVAFADFAHTWEHASEDNWIEHKGKHYCPACWCYDDNDNLIFAKNNNQ